MMYESVLTKEFIRWRDGLKDAMARKRIAARIIRAEAGNFGDWAPEGGEVRAMRIDYGPGYRLYYTIRDNTIIFLLCGGDKRTQQSDIATAQKLAEEV
jgi:putative addiction module killer protein